MKELYNNQVVLQNTVPIVTASATNIVGTAVDMQGFNALLYIWSVGIASGSLSGSVKTHLLLEKAPDSAGSPGAYVAVVTDDLLGGAVAVAGVVATVDAAAEDPAIFKFGILPDPAYRFYRATIVVTGNPLAPVALDAIKGLPLDAPVA